MQNWDPQAMLDLYIHNYLIRKNMNATAEIFAREANFIPKGVAVDCPEGFLAEWWSLFWTCYSARFSNDDEATEDLSFKVTQADPNAEYTTQDVHPVMPSPDADYMMQAEATQSSIDERTSKQYYVGVPLPFGDLNSGSQLLNVDQLAAGMMPSSSNLCHLSERVYSGPQLSFTREDIYAAEPTRHLRDVTELEAGPSDAGILMCEQDHFGLPVNNVDQLPCLLPSSSNFSYPLEKVHDEFPPSVARDDQCGTSLWEPNNAEPPMPIQFNTEPTYTDARMHWQRFLGLPIADAQDLHVDQPAPMLPSPNNCSHPPRNKKHQRSVTGDDKRGSSSRRPVTVLPTQYAPMTLQPRRETKPCEQGHLRDFNSHSQLVDINQLAHLLLSSGNYSQLQSNDDKKSQPSLTRDESRGANSVRSIAEPCCPAPKPLQSKPDLLVNTGSSTSSNSANSNPSSRI